MQSCPECSNESVAAVWIALIIIVGALVVWRNRSGKAWGYGLALLAVCMTVVGGGMIACRSFGPADSEE